MGGLTVAVGLGLGTTVGDVSFPGVEVDFAEVAEAVPEAVPFEEVGLELLAI